MSDDSPAGDPDPKAADTDRDPIQIRFSVSRAWVEEKLLPAYPAVTRVSQAARHAVIDGVADKEHCSTVEARIGEDALAALRELGGKIENRQSVHIDANGNVAVDEDNAVSVEAGDGSEDDG